MTDVLYLDKVKDSYLENLHVAVILGSSSDQEHLAKSKLFAIFSDLGIRYIVVTLSAHRNPRELAKFCRKVKKLNEGIVFIAAAGLSAALPGVIKSIVIDSTVIGVPLDKEFALPSIFSMPGGIPVPVTGSIGSPGLTNAALLAGEILSRNDNPISKDKYKKYLMDMFRDKRPMVIIKYPDETEEE